MSASRRVPLGLVGVLAVALALFGWALFHGTRSSTPSPQPATAIAVAKVERRDVPVSINALAQAQGWQAVVVRAQVNGTLLQVPVREGSDVAKGDLIAEIDPAPFRAGATQAQGALSRDQAQLELARLKLTRYRELGEEDSIAGLDVDTQAALVEPARRHGHGRPGRGRRRPGQPELHPHRRAGGRPRRRAPGRRRQRRLHRRTPPASSPSTRSRRSP